MQTDNNSHNNQTKYLQVTHTWAEHVSQNILNPVWLKRGSLKQSEHSSCARIPHSMHC